MSEKNMSAATDSEEKASVNDIREDDISKDKSRKRQGIGTGCFGKIRITVAGAAVLALTLLCMTFLAWISALNGRIGALTERMDRMNQVAMKQQEVVERLSAMLDTARNAGGGEEAESAEDGPQGAAVEANSQGVTGPVRPEVTAAHRVYLTFDDGPSVYTQKILDILDRYDVKATFFVVGTEDGEMMRKIVEAGHTLGMHSCTHDYDLLYGSPEDFAADFARQQEYIYGATGVKSTVYRFPGGSSNAVSGTSMKVFAEYLDRQGARFFDWNISSGDGGGFVVPVETLIEKCTTGIKGKGDSVILMHDRAGKGTTVEALPVIIEKIQAMKDTVLLPITEDTPPVQHIQWEDGAR